MIAASPDWDWWVKSDAGLLARLAIGAAVFTALAVWDLARRGRGARRWREYLFLLAAAGGGVAYGSVNDSISSAVSWEYFYYGKGLADELGPWTPPDPAALRRGAAVLGMKAAGSAGLLAGAVLLLANNPGRRRPDRCPPPLSHRRLLALLPGVLLTTAACAALFAGLGYLGALAWTSQELRLAAREGLFRPARFQCAYGIHLGGYVGGGIGLARAVWRVRNDRRLSGAARPEGKGSAEG